MAGVFLSKRVGVFPIKRSSSEGAGQNEQLRGEGCHLVSPPHTNSQLLNTTQICSRAAQPSLGPRGWCVVGPGSRPASSSSHLPTYLQASYYYCRYLRVGGKRGVVGVGS